MLSEGGEAGMLYAGTGCRQVEQKGGGETRPTSSCAAGIVSSCTPQLGFTSAVRQLMK